MKKQVERIEYDEVLICDVCENEEKYKNEQGRDKIRAFTTLHGSNSKVYHVCEDCKDKVIDLGIQTAQCERRPPAKGK